MTTSGDTSLPNEHYARRPRDVKVPAGSLASERSPNYIAGYPDRHAAMRADAVTNRECLRLDEIAIKQRKLSPQFPTLAEASMRRRHFWQKTVARTGIVVAGLAVVAAIFTDAPAIWSGGSLFIGGVIFVATCFVAARMNRHD